MSDSPTARERRDRVLGAVRAALAGQGGAGAREAIVRGRLENRPASTIPERGKAIGAKKIRLFAEMAVASGASVAQVKTKSEVLEEVARFLKSRNLPARLVHGEDPYIGSLNWQEHRGLEHRGGAAEADDPVSLTRAFGGVAETGTLVMLSGPDNPVTLNFLPMTAITLVESSAIAGAYEKVWERIREAFADGALPRTVNWVTGPSRSADIAQTLTLGAHGPGNLHIIIVG